MIFLQASTGWHALLEAFSYFPQGEVGLYIGSDLTRILNVHFVHLPKNSMQASLCNNLCLTSPLLSKLGPYFSYLYIPITPSVAPCWQELLTESVVCG